MQHNIVLQFTGSARQWLPPSQPIKPFRGTLITINELCWQRETALVLRKLELGQGAQPGSESTSKLPKDLQVFGSGLVC